MEDASALATLVGRLRRSESEAEDWLIRTFRDRVFAMAVARARDRDAALDLTQDALWAVVQALRKGQLRDPDKLAAFVSGTARNVINNFLRTRARTGVDVPVQSEHAVNDPRFAIDEADRIRQVHAALKSLDPVDRRILELTLVEGLTPQDIARELRLSSDVVRQRKSRAVRRVIGLIGGVTNAADPTTDPESTP